MGVYSAELSQRNDKNIVDEAWDFIKEERRKYKCPRGLHTVDRKRGIKDTETKGQTYCEVCGVILIWKESEDGVWEFWEKTE